MLDKYFGFLKIQDEYSVMDSLIEHTRIDEEEIYLLHDMVEFLCNNNHNKIQEHYDKIQKISIESNRIFENAAEQIIQANFDHQKQYDLLRLYQRIESISDNILNTAKRISILNNIQGTLPEECKESVKKLTKGVKELHNQFKFALTQYQNNKKDLIETINKIEDEESKINQYRFEAIEELYKLGNTDKLPLGTLRANENIMDHLENTAFSIQEAATSLEWLLIY